MADIYQLKTNKNNFADYIIYVDESGDHSTKKINDDYPIFVLTFCIFNKNEYVDTIVPKLNKLKMKYWGHCDTVLHEHDIRKKRKGEWSILSDRNTASDFIQDITEYIEDTSFNVITVVIDKKELIERYESPRNPYEISMLFCMERLHKWLVKKHQTGKKVSIQVESRGAREDKELENEMLRIFNNNNQTTYSKIDFSNMQYTVKFLDKKSNSTGLQISDLIARPIGMHVLRPHQQNKAFDVVENKIIKSSSGNIKNIGLKKFPQ